MSPTWEFVFVFSLALRWIKFGSNSYTASLLVSLSLSFLWHWGGLSLHPDNQTVIPHPSLYTSSLSVSLSLSLSLSVLWRWRGLNLHPAYQTNILHPSKCLCLCLCNFCGFEGDQVCIQQLIKQLYQGRNPLGRNQRNQFATSQFDIADIKEDKIKIDLERKLYVFFEGDQVFIKLIKQLYHGRTPLPQL